MNIPLIDKSSYLRGLLILARKDNQISNIQKAMILSAGKRLGFSSEFCEDTLKTLLFNRCLCDNPIKFENYNVAQSFVEDGLRLTCTGKKICKAELNWLRRSAKINDLSLNWFEKELLKYEMLSGNIMHTQLALNSII